jgi:hypothetical protein
MIWRLLALLVRYGLGLLLFYATLCLVIALLRSPAIQGLLVSFSLLLGCLWALWRKLPDWMQEILRSLWKRKEGSDD